MTAAAKAASKAATFKRVYLAQFDFDSGTTYVNTSDRTFAYDIDNDGNDESFLGVAGFGKFTEIREGSELRAYGVSAELSGVPLTFPAVSLNEQVYGRPMKIWEAFLDDSYRIIDDPVLMFEGAMDTMDSELGATARVILTAWDRKKRWEQGLDAPRYTNADQQLRFPSDLGLEFVNQTVDKELVWGRPS